MWAYVQRNLTNQRVYITIWVTFYPTKETLTGSQGKWIKSDAYDAASETWYPRWTLDIPLAVKVKDTSTVKNTVEEGDQAAKLEQDPINNVNNVSMFAWCCILVCFFFEVSTAPADVHETAEATCLYIYICIQFYK